MVMSPCQTLTIGWKRTQKRPTSGPPLSMPLPVITWTEIQISNN